MKFESIWANPKNSIMLVDREWAFKTDDDRPAFVRISQEKLILWLGECRKKHIHDGQFIEAWSCKMDEKNVSWEMVEKKLKPLTITIKDF